MFTSNPFAVLGIFLSPLAMQAYIVAVIIAVAGGTMFDMLHKSSAKFFSMYLERSKAAATKTLSSGDKASIAVKTLAVEIATSAEFCNPQRRISHLFMFYGFILYCTTTITMVFGYPTPATPTPVALPLLWNLGAVMILIGGYWFFFFLRVNVAKDGQPVFRLVRADLFIVTLLASVTFALVWEFAQSTGNPTATKVALGLYLFFTTALFGSVAWSKLPHMFYKPVMAFQRRVEEADGSSSLPSTVATHEGR